ncbi:MAG: hypothetical protein EOP04_10145 [Proteobacteria bacterium]|nr:MAG: hypothetical protein EOP04_10145 [Pseudomonadota bacterium]
MKSLKNFFVLSLLAYSSLSAFAEVQQPCAQFLTRGDDSYPRCMSGTDDQPVAGLKEIPNLDASESTEIRKGDTTLEYNVSKKSYSLSVNLETTSKPLTIELRPADLIALFQTSDNQIIAHVSRTCHDSPAAVANAPMICKETIETDF